MIDPVAVQQRPHLQAVNVHNVTVDAARTRRSVMRSRASVAHSSCAETGSERVPQQSNSSRDGLI